MKRLASILLCLACLRMHAADLVLSNNAIICVFGDSWMVGGSPPDNMISGYRFPDYVWSYFVLNNPTNNLSFYNLSRSGGTMDEMLTNRLQQDGLAAWDYASNNFQHIGIACMTDNGDLNSNQMYLSLSNAFQAPGIMSDGSATLNVQTGQAATHPVRWIGLGEPPHTGAGPDTQQGARNDAATNAGWVLGIRGVDSFNILSPSWFADFTANGGTNVQLFASPLLNHFASGGGLSWAFAFLKSITSDTNISTCVIDFNSAIGAATNHCVISSVSRSGNTLTFNRIDDRLPPAWDVPDGTITNDATTAFNLNPSDATYFHFDLQITNLPTGNYDVTIDGQRVATVSSGTFSAGWNMITNYAGPYWAQRKEVLGRIRDVEYVNRNTLVPGSAGDALGEISYVSFAGSHWIAGLRGDALIASMHTNISFLTTNASFSFAAIKAAAQPTNHTFTVKLVSPFFAPFHR
jgi:hypothetical protein